MVSTEPHPTSLDDIATRLETLRQDTVRSGYDEAAVFIQFALELVKGAKDGKGKPA